MADALAAPYVSFGVFKSTIDALAEVSVPTGPIDRRVLDGLSGADYGALISGLRFLGLVDNDRKAAPTYRALVEASKDAAKFKVALLDIITSAYKPVTGTLDLKSGTAAQVEKAFRDYGTPPGQMMSKAIRFYIKALTECGVPVSPHITKAKRAPAQNKNGALKARIRKPKSQDQSDGIVKHDTGSTPTGFERLPIPGLKDAYIQYPADITEANFALFEAMIGVLGTYVKNRAGKEKR
jgi:hypothetical protein